MSEPAPEPQPRQRAGGGKITQTFTTRIGPLPMWVWLVIAGGILVAWRLYSKKAGASSAASTADTSTSASDVPQFVNQTYVTTTPPQAGPPGPPGAPGEPGPEGPPFRPPVKVPPNRTPPVGKEAPGMVTGIKGTGATSNSISAAWSKVTGAASYIVRVTYQGKLVKQMVTHSPFATITGLGPDHTYTVHVAAVGPGGTSSESNGPAIKTTR